MKLKKDDVVVVMSGKDRGKKGKIIQVLSDMDKVVVEGVNKSYRHMKAKRGKEKGERVEYNAPIPASRVMVFCQKCSAPVKLGYKVQDNKKVRICKKCKGLIKN
jgi:large subunit ribosomal protein L24